MGKCLLVEETVVLSKVISKIDTCTASTRPKVLLRPCWGAVEWSKWGDAGDGGDSSFVQDGLKDQVLQHIYSK